VACLERELHELLAHFACPEAHRKTVRTTTVIERCF
jgi:transposase-like protein